MTIFSFNNLSVMKCIAIFWLMLNCIHKCDPLGLIVWKWYYHLILSKYTLMFLKWCNYLTIHVTIVRQYITTISLECLIWLYSKLIMIKMNSCFLSLYATISIHTLLFLWMQVPRNLSIHKNNFLIDI